MFTVPNNFCGMQVERKTKSRYIQIIPPGRMQRILIINDKFNLKYNLHQVFFKSELYL